MLYSLFKNASFSVISQFVNIAIGVLFVPLYLYYLGIEGFGVYSLIIMLFGWLTILQAGVDPAITKLIAQYFAENQFKKINSLITLGFIIQFIMAGLIGILIYLNVDVVAKFLVKDAIHLLEETKIALTIGAVNIVVLMCKNVYVAFFKGMQRYDLTSIFSSTFSITASVLSLIFLWLGYGLIGIISARLILNVLSLVVLGHFSKRILSSLRFTSDISKGVLIEIIHFGSWVIVSRLNRLAVNALPPILINQYLGPTGVTYYKIAITVVMAINNLLSSVVNVVFPHVSELMALKNTEKIKTLYSKANSILSYISAPMYCFCIIFSWQIIYMWLGEEMANAMGNLMPIFLVGYYLSSASMLPSVFSLGLGKTKILAVSGTLQTIVVFLALPVLLREFDILGAGFNLIAFEAVSIISGAIITIKYVNGSVFKYWVNERMTHIIVICFIYLQLYFILTQLSLLDLDRIYMVFVLFSAFIAGLSAYIFVSLKIKLAGYETVLKLTNEYIKKTTGQM